MGFEKNQRYTVTIEDMGSDGEGIGKADGYPLFIKDAIIGDTVEAKITKARRNYAFARLEKVITPSPFRVQPKCPYSRQCGGCKLQAMSYERQLQFKQDKIRGNLIHIAGMDADKVDACMEPIVGMEEPYHYRNKAQYPVGTDREGRLVTGFYAGHSHTIIPNTDCCLGKPENKKILETVLSYMKQNHVTAYDEQSGTGLVRHILIRTGFESGEIMVCLVINRLLDEQGRRDQGKRQQKVLPCQDELVAALRRIPGMTSVSVNSNTGRTNVIMGEKVRTLWGSDTIEDSLYIRDTSDFQRTQQNLTFRLSPLSFYQVNPLQAEKLYSLALEFAGLTGRETVWDLYCGIGTISLFLAKRAGKVYGVEIVPEAVRDAKDNAERNQVGNVEFYVGKAEEVLPRLYEEEGIHADVMVVDPPRKGCDPDCLDTMVKMRPERIVYISCDPATLARDLKMLRGNGYEVGKWRGVDMFGMGGHVETAVLLVRKP